MTNEKTSRQRKAYGLILVLALGGLAVDRLVLDGGATGPQSAEAIGGAPVSRAVAAEAKTKTETNNPATRASTLAGRLDRTAKEKNFNLLQVDDAFRPAASWIKPAAAAVMAQAAEPVSEAEAFTKKHKLLALLNNAHGGAAIIGSQTVVLGKQIDGFTLVGVTKRSALLEKDGQRVELSLPVPNANPAKSGD